MNLPAFDEFLIWLTPEKMDEILKNHYMPQSQTISFQPNDIEALKQLPQLVKSFAVEEASRISLAQLHAYHQWLEETL